jgi:hypothetical protein
MLPYLPQSAHEMGEGTYWARIDSPLTPEAWRLGWP